MSARTLLSAAVFLTVSAALPAAEPDVKKDPNAPVSYYREVRPIFVLNCQGCHQPAKPLGGFVMTNFADLLKAGDHDQPGIVPGQPDKSFIVEQITVNKSGMSEMPRNKDPLAKKDIELITRWIAQGAKDDTPKTAGDVVDAKHPPIYALPPVITALDYSPDSQLLAVSGYHEVLLHKADGSGLVARLVGLSERINGIAFSPDGKQLAVAAGSPGRFGEVQIWELEKNTLRLSISATFDTVYGVSWSHDGTKIAFGCGDNSVRAIETEKGQQILFQGAHTDWVLGTAFSKDSRFVASISRDRSMKLTEVSTQRFVDNITSITPGALKGGLLAVARNPVKREDKVKPKGAGVDTSDRWFDELLIGGADGVPRLYKMHREQKRVIGDDLNFIRNYPALSGRINAVAFHPDGSKFVAGSSLDGSGEVRVYQTADAKMVSKMEGQPGAVFALAWRPDGAQIAVAGGGLDGMIRLMDPATGKVVKEFVAVPLTKP